jgi:hypothetical protein
VVATVATPELFKLPLPRLVVGLVEVSVNVTHIGVVVGHVGVALPEPFTVAVRVTDAPENTVLPLVARVVVLLALLMT